MTVEELHIPEELKRLKGWLIWRSEPQGAGKPRKVPYYVRGGRRSGTQGSESDRAQLVPLTEALATCRKLGFDGVGLALMPEWGITALDFDHVVSPEGVLRDEVAEIVSETYAEFSPSGSGVRAFVKGDLADRKSRVGTSDYGFETFSSKGFVTVTGRHLESTGSNGLENVIAPVSSALRRLYEARFGGKSRIEATQVEDPFDRFEQPLGLSDEKIGQLLAKLDPSWGRERWIRVGMGLHHETGGDERGFEHWDQWSAAGRQYPGTDDLRAEWNSFSRRDGSIGRPVTMRSVVKLAREAGSRAPKIPTRSGLPEVIPEVASRACGDGRMCTPDGFSGAYLIVAAHEFARRAPPQWIIKGVLPAADLGVVYGAPGSGKSFFVLDLALSVARGVEWRGRKVTQRRVLYLVAEGGSGAALRLQAYRQHHELADTSFPLGVMASQPNLLHEEDVGEIISSINAAGGAGLIIIDTLAQTTAGANENSAEDMGRAIRNCRELKEQTGAMVLLVHHSGKDQGRGARGWSGLRAACDLEIEVVRSEGTRTARITKMKDGADDGEFHFELSQVDLGKDDDGDEVTSLVVVPASGPGRKPRKLGRSEAVVMEAVEWSLVDGKMAEIERVLDRALQKLAPAASPTTRGRDQRRSNLRRALNALVTKRHLSATDIHVWIPA